MTDKMLIDTKALVGSEVFAGEKPTLNILVQSVHKAVAEFKGDTSTAKGRDEIKSMAFKVTKSKTAISDLGKEYLEPAKQALKDQGDNIKIAVADLDELAKKVRKPLSDWQEEQDRIASEIDNRLEVMSFIASVSDKESQYYIDGLAEVESIVIDDSWGKKINQAEMTKKNTIDAIKVKLDAALKHESDQRELEELREQNRIREEQITKENAERDAKQREEQAKLDEERRKRDEKERAEKAESDRIERERLAKEREDQIRLEEAEKAEKAKDEAIEQERQRVERETQRVTAEAKAREDNKEHKKKINNKAMNALIKLGLTKDDAKKVIEGIYLDKVPNVSIRY